MKFLKLIFRPETAVPMLALIFASGVSAALVLTRAIWTGNIRYTYLIWNLGLAWLPLVFALLACDHYEHGLKWNWRFFAAAGAWLLFFPNAPYIFTDLIHLTTRYYGHFWVDMVLVLLCALTGLILGFLSLYLMQSLVARRVGWWMSWLFIAGVAGVGSLGVYLGRFMRFNSWDVVFKPFELFRGIGDWAANPEAQPTTLAFPILFAAFVFITYVMLYALTHLRHSHPPERQPPNPLETTSPGGQRPP